MKTPLRALPLLALAGFCPWSPAFAVEPSSGVPAQPAAVAESAAQPGAEQALAAILSTVTPEEQLRLQLLSVALPPPPPEASALDRLAYLALAGDEVALAAERQALAERQASANPWNTIEYFNRRLLLSYRDFTPEERASVAAAPAVSFLQPDLEATAAILLAGAEAPTLEKVLQGGHRSYLATLNSIALLQERLRRRDAAAAARLLAAFASRTPAMLAIFRIDTLVLEASAPVDPQRLDAAAAAAAAVLQGEGLQAVPAATLCCRMLLARPDAGSARLAMKWALELQRRGATAAGLRLEAACRLRLGDTAGALPILLAELRAAPVADRPPLFQAAAAAALALPEDGRRALRAELAAWLPSCREGLESGAAQELELALLALDPQALRALPANFATLSPAQQRRYQDFFIRSLILQRRFDLAAAACRDAAARFGAARDEYQRRALLCSLAAGSSAAARDSQARSILGGLGQGGLLAALDRVEGGSAEIYEGFLRARHWAPAVPGCSRELNAGPLQQYRLLDRLDPAAPSLDLVRYLDCRRPPATPAERP